MLPGGLIRFMISCIRAKKSKQGIRGWFAQLTPIKWFSGIVEQVERPREYERWSGIARSLDSGIIARLLIAKGRELDLVRLVDTTFDGYSELQELYSWNLPPKTSK